MRSWRSDPRTLGVAAALLVLDAVLLGLSLPVQLIFVLGQLWESDDAALLHRMTTAIIPLELAALVTGTWWPARVLPCGVGAAMRSP